MDEFCWFAISGVHGSHELRFFIRPLKNSLLPYGDSHSGVTPSSSLRSPTPQAFFDSVVCT